MTEGKKYTANSPNDLWKILTQEYNNNRIKVYDLSFLPEESQENQRITLKREDLEMLIRLDPKADMLHKYSVDKIENFNPSYLQVIKKLQGKGIIQMVKRGVSGAEKDYYVLAKGTFTGYMPLNANAVTPYQPPVTQRLLGPQPARRETATLSNHRIVAPPQLTQATEVVADLISYPGQRNRNKVIYISDYLKNHPRKNPWVRFPNSKQRGAKIIELDEYTSKD